MSLERKLKERRKRRALRVRKRAKASQPLRVSVFRSLRQFYGQIIDDSQGRTLVSCSTLELKPAQADKKSAAHAVGLELAKRAKKQGIESAAFDRGKFLYHGRVEAFAQGLREGGLHI